MANVSWYIGLKEDGGYELRRTSRPITKPWLRAWGPFKTHDEAMNKLEDLKGYVPLSEMIRSPQTGRFIKKYYKNPRRIDVHREQEKAYGSGIHIDIGSHNVRPNPKHRESVRVLAFRRRMAPQRIMKRRTFREIEAESARRYGSKARGRAAAGAAYWCTAEAKARHARANPVQYFVQYQVGNHWRTLAAFTHKAQAIDYGRALKRRHRGKVLRIWWK